MNTKTSKEINNDLGNNCFYTYVKDLNTGIEKRITNAFTKQKQVYVRTMDGETIMVNNHDIYSK